MKIVVLVNRDDKHLAQALEERKRIVKELKTDGVILLQPHMELKIIDCDIHPIPAIVKFEDLPKKKGLF